DLAGAGTRERGQVCPGPRGDPRTPRDGGRGGRRRIRGLRRHGLQPPHGARRRRPSGPDGRVVAVDDGALAIVALRV
ncbi:MAG: hypothetical protein AVDCRST_MAG60-2282, partial [uncultured Nocardioides sp.]